MVNVPAQRGGAAAGQVGERLTLRTGQMPAVPVEELRSAVRNYIRHAPRRPLECDGHGRPSIVDGTAIRSSRLGVFAKCRRLTCR